jgi:hypothetical protein
MAENLTAQEQLVLQAANELYYLDWRENDDDEKTAGWRHPGYFVEVNMTVDFGKLVEAGLMEYREAAPQTGSYRITGKGMNVVKTLSADTDITNHCPQCADAADAIKHINNLVLMLTDVARGDWQQYQYTAEGRDVIIDRIDNQITHHLNALAVNNGCHAAD